MYGSKIYIFPQEYDAEKAEKMWMNRMVFAVKGRREIKWTWNFVFHTGVSKSDRDVL